MMTLRNTTERYGSMAIGLHWFVAFLVFGLLIVGFLMGDLAKPLRLSVYNVHKLLGLTVLCTMLFRVYWKLSNIKLNYPATIARWQITAARSVHLLLYVAVISMALSGWLMATFAGHPPMIFDFHLAIPGLATSKAMAKEFAVIHQYLAWIIIGATAAHVFAALKHHFINRDDIYRRMLPWR